MAAEGDAEAPPTAVAQQHTTMTLTGGEIPQLDVVTLLMVRAASRRAHGALLCCVGRSQACLRPSPGSGCFPCWQPRGGATCACGWTTPVSAPQVRRGCAVVTGPASPVTRRITTGCVVWWWWWCVSRGLCRCCRRREPGPALHGRGAPRLRADRPRLGLPGQGEPLRAWRDLPRRAPPPARPVRRTPAGRRREASYLVGWMVRGRSVNAVCPLGG